jgi:hypothetical protein
MGELLYKTLAYSGFIVSPLCCGWAWWSWLKTEKSSIRRWRRAASELGLGLLTAGIGLGVFSISYLYKHPELGRPGLPDATITSMETGAVVGLAALLVSLFAKSWTRIALLLSSIGLLWFLYLIALSP